jgi:glycosyltransferase involved in cell wall biosynthesis
MERMGAILTLADALLVHLKDDPLFAITVPSKTQAYFYVGRPVIMAVRGDGAELVRRSGAGVVCEPGDGQSIAAAVADLARRPSEELRAMGARGRAFYDAELSLRRGVTRYLAIMRSVVARATQEPR